MEEPEPTEFLAVDVYAPSAIDVYDYLTLSFTEPVASIDTTAFHLKLKVDSLWQDIPFDFMRDSLDLKRYNLFAEWAPGESYTFEVDSAAIRGLYGLFSDKIKKDFKAKEAGRVRADILLMCMERTLWLCWNYWTVRTKCCARCRWWMGKPISISSIRANMERG